MSGDGRMEQARTGDKPQMRACEVTTMRSSIRVLSVLAGGAILVSACGSAAPATSATAAPVTAAPVTAAAATAAPATPAPGLVLAHKAGEVHKLQPKRLESVLEIDMGDHFFANVEGVKNPTFALATGKTVGIHLHNEGAVLHEIMIGRNLNAKKDDYEQNLTELVASDVFFYYGSSRAEIGGAKYGEIEMDVGMRDGWIRINIPANLKGEWEIGCFAEDHYDKGMHAKLIFQ
jgi:uncharacterized cupredoxin-like copper-binding protein